MKINFYLFVAAIMLMFATTTKAASVEPSTTTWKSYTQDEVKAMTLDQQKSRVVEIKARIAEIKAMDKSTLTREEKKELRSELKSMRSEAKVMDSAAGGGGIYLSVGAIIIIILILILILH
jgi:phosphomevalonate kinase